MPFRIVAAARVEDLSTLRVLDALVALALAGRHDVKMGLQDEAAPAAAAGPGGKHVGAHVVRVLVQIRHRNVMRILRQGRAGRALPQL